MIEQEGLAAWIAAIPSTSPGTLLRAGFGIEEPWQKEFVFRLADLVVGQRREVNNG